MIVTNNIFIIELLRLGKAKFITVSGMSLEVGRFKVVATATPRPGQAEPHHHHHHYYLHHYGKQFWNTMNKIATQIYSKSYRKSVHPRGIAIPKPNQPIHPLYHPSPLQCPTQSSLPCPTHQPIHPCQTHPVKLNLLPNPSPALPTRQLPPQPQHSLIPAHLPLCHPSPQKLAHLPRIEPLAIHHPRLGLDSHLNPFSILVTAQIQADNHLDSRL